MSPKTAGGVLLALIVALGVGWVWGASGTAAIETARRRTENRLQLETARVHVLDGRLALVGNDYARADAAFASAVTALSTLQRSLREVGLAERAGRIEIVLSDLSAARQATASQNANAWSAADTALQALAGLDLPE